MQQLSLADLETILSELHAKARENMDVLPLEEKKKLIELFGTVADKVGAIQEELKQSVDTDNNECMVLKMCGQFPRDASGDIIIPTKENLTAVLNSSRQRNMSMAPLTVSVQFVRKEENFPFLTYGPTCSNYLFHESEVYVGFESVLQADYVRGYYSSGNTTTVFCGLDPRGGELRGCFQFRAPSQDTRIRAAYREIGTLIERLKKVDAQLKALGAVPGRGGVPELPDMLVQKETFDETVKCYQESSEQKVLLHSFLSTRTRVDKRKRQGTIESLVNERIEILLKLSQFDPDEFPVVIEREFK